MLRRRQQHTSVQKRMTTRMTTRSRISSRRGLQEHRMIHRMDVMMIEVHRMDVMMIEIHGMDVMMIEIFDVAIVALKCRRRPKRPPSSDPGIRQTRHRKKGKRIWRKGTCRTGLGAQCASRRGVEKIRTTTTQRKKKKKAYRE